MTNPWRVAPQPEVICKIDKEKFKDYLSISWDVDSDPEDLTQWKVVLLWQHRLDEEHIHEHISLTQEEAKKLHSWLGRFLKKVK